jgi:hypothetical protein
MAPAQLSQFDASRSLANSTLPPINVSLFILEELPVFLILIRNRQLDFIEETK